MLLSLLLVTHNLLALIDSSQCMLANLKNLSYTIFFSTGISSPATIKRFFDNVHIKLTDIVEYNLS
jgi:hypothetical protein